MKKNTAFFVLVLLLNINIFSAQSVLTEITLSQQIENSSLVIEGKVISKESFWDAENQLIYTSNTIEVYKVFKGKYIETIEVITVGGTVGLDALISSTSLKLREGNVGIFMLYDSNVNLSQNKQNSTKQFKPYSSSQGFYKYDLYGNTASNPFGKRNNIKDSFYKEITDKTKTNYIDVKSFDTSIYAKEATASKVLASSSITNFTPTTASAGTQSVLTINGSGFGGSIGTVSFANADDGGSTFIDALDTQIISWSDTAIQVEIPSEAGTGKISVSGGVSPFTSTGDLTIEYSETNVEYDPDGSGAQLARAYNVQHYGQSANFGYLWSMQTDFFNDTEHPGARAAFERAFDTWRCNTGINWTIANSATTVDVRSSSDNVNVIRFDNGSELESGVLGTCYSYYQGCGSYPNIDWYVSGMDIVFDGDISYWNFGPGATTGLEYDFQSVVLHELGHGHQLAHVNDTNDLMNWNIGLLEDQRVLESPNIIAASNVQERSTTNVICNLSLMNNYSGSCSLSVAEDELNNNLLVYPNPVRNQLFIKSALSINLVKATMYDINGRLISEYDISNPSKVKTIDLLNVSKGMYFLKIKSDTAEVTKKVMVY